MLEREIQHAVRLALGTDPRVVLWRNAQGFYREEGRAIQYGIGGAGGSDLIGMLRGSGRWVALEIKTATGRTTPEQERFLSLVRKCGGFACVVRSVDEARAAVTRACAGASE